MRNDPRWIGIGHALILVGAFLACGAAMAAPACRALGSADLLMLERSHSLGDIRVFWTERAPASGSDHRLPDSSRQDRNGNGVPDFVENIAIQADAARRAFVQLGFRDPLASPAYREVRHIDINLLAMPSHNGRAYDGAVHYPRAPGRGESCTLRIDISTLLETRMVGSGDGRRRAEFTRDWFVVAHEMFHLFQYGMTRFKRGWINEPTAKWAEYALRRGETFPLDDAPPETLPPTFETFEMTVIRLPLSAAANRYWRELIELAEPAEAKVVLLLSLMSLTYTDGRPVFKDGVVRGASFVSRVFERLGEQSDKLSDITGLSRYRWREQFQTSSSHDRQLFDLIRGLVGSR